MREPEPIGRHRTYARVALSLCAAWVVSLAAQADPASAKVPRLVFPVVGHAHYQDDFGDPRGQGSHEGNDILAGWKAPVVAVEPGRVRIYTRSASAGCMLYLYGRSGTTYLYIHLNNDRTPRNDNRGGCKPGVAYAPGLVDGQRVRTGQLVGYVGDSGDADGIAHHLHFELHPDDGGAVSPYRYLRRAERLLFALPEDQVARGTAAAATLTLVGSVVSFAAAPPGEEPPPAGSSEVGQGGGSSAPPPPPPPERAAAGPPGTLAIRVRAVRLPGGEGWRVTRRVVLEVGADAVLERASGKKVRWAALAAGAKVAVTTAPVALTLEAQRARPGALRAARVLVR